MPGMNLRAPLAILIALIALFGCGVARNYRFTFHKAHVSQDQLLRDQASLREVSGVLAVFATPHQDGSGSIEVETKDGEDIEVQQRLTTMGYTRGQH